MPIFSKYLLGLIGLSLVLLPLASTRPTSLPAAVDDIEIDHVTLRIFERANIRPLGRWEPYQKYLKSLRHRPRILVSNDVPRSELSDGKYTFEQFGAEWEVPWSADDTKLGSGGIGTVYAGHYRRDGESQQRAVIKVASGGGFMRGAEVMKKLDSPRIMKALAFFRYQKSKPKNDFLVMPFYEHTSDAKAELNNGRLFEEAKWVACFQQLLQAIEVMHTTFDNDDKEGFAHGDIKPANILGIADGPGLEPTSYKLIDFDFAAPQSKDSKTGGGTVSFMSPGMHFPYLIHPFHRDLDPYRTHHIQRKCIFQIPRMKNGRLGKQSNILARARMYLASVWSWFASHSNARWMPILCSSYG